jgi:glycosyltransferase involved in cell wall biosynthesis
MRWSLVAEASTFDVAVVIPARPNEPFLAEAVASVLWQPEVVELAVATHHTGSPTAVLAAEHPDPRVHLVISRGPSAGANLDAGIAATTAPWLAFLDADDLWPPGRIAAGLRAAQSVEGIDLIIGRLQEMDAEGKLLDAIVPAPVPGTALITRTAAEEVGPFGEDLIAQMRWMVRARELGIAAIELDRVMLHRRAHSSNLSRLRRPELQRAYLTLAREHASRRRRAEGEVG